MNRLRTIARQGRRFLKASRTKLLRRAGFLKGGWNEGLPHELQFWANALRDPDKNWVRQEYEDRTNPDLELQAELRELIPAGTGATVRILDVGAGPLTRIGKRWPGRELEIVAVDPLAEQYNALLSNISLRPLVPVTSAHGEKLGERFPRNSFHLAYASNSLDHSYDPMVVMEQMLAVVKPAHFVYLWHFANVGVDEAYTGLHQWNFDIRRNDFVISNGQRTASVSALLEGKARVTCQFTHAFGQKVVIAKLQKSA